MNKIVIKLSGRVFADDGEMLSKTAAAISKLCKVCQPVAIAGGGPVARRYISQARTAGADESSLDELGIEVSRLNAKILVHALGSKAWPQVPTTLEQAQRAASSGLAVVAGGLYPGQSTNGTAALIAERIGAAQFINATDVEGVYDKDPNKYGDAKLLKRVKLKELRSMMMRQESVAGGHDLMDLVALKIIERSRIKTRILKADARTLEKAVRQTGAPGTEIVL